MPTRRSWINDLKQHEEYEDIEDRKKIDNECDIWIDKSDDLCAQIGQQ